MGKVLIIGGGFAGISAAVFLSKSNHKITLLEASPKLGGRAYSFFVKSRNEYVDNGQHILMGCYRHTLTFLSEIGAVEKLYFQKSLFLNLIENNGKTLTLGSNSRFYPFNLINALLSFPRFNYMDKISLLKFFVKLPFLSKDKLSGLSVEKWLTETKQTVNAKKYFWDLLIVGALNTNPSKASAEIFLEILREMFLHGNKATTIIIPETDLSNLYCTNAEEYLKNKGGIILKSEKVIEFITKQNKIVEVLTNKGNLTEFDYVVSAIPLNALRKIKNSGLSGLRDNEPEYSSILSVHLWIENFDFEKKFYGFIDSDIHWLFNHGKHITLVTSNAGNLMSLTNNEILKKVVNEVSNYFPGFNMKNVTDSQIIKEKRATFVPSSSFEKRRKKIISPYSNLIFAGDWTNTGLPSTIESAVKSGKLAADTIDRAL